MAPAFGGMNKFMEKQCKKTLIDAIKWLEKILKGSDKE